MGLGIVSGTWKAFVCLNASPSNAERKKHDLPVFILKNIVEKMNCVHRKCRRGECRERKGLIDTCSKTATLFLQTPHDGKLKGRQPNKKRLVGFGFLLLLEDMNPYASKTNGTYASLSSSQNLKKRRIEFQKAVKPENGFQNSFASQQSPPPAGKIMKQISKSTHGLFDPAIVDKYLKWEAIVRVGPGHDIDWEV